MPRFRPGDCVKVEFKDEATGKSKRLWVVVDFCGDGAGVLFAGSTTSRWWARVSTWAMRLQ